MANRKMLGAAAMAGALTIGGVVGVALGSPSVSGAQKAGTPTTTTAPGQPGPGGRQGPGRGGPGLRGGGELDAAAKALGISVDDLQKSLADGKSIADVAKDKGVSKQKVIDAMVAAATKRLDAEKKALPDQIAKLVDGSFKAGPGKDGFGKGGPGKGGFGGPGGFDFGKASGLDAAAKALGISTDDLTKALRDGKSIADVAKDKGVAEQKVIDAIVTAQKANIAQAVKDKKLTQAQADKITKDIDDHVKSMVEGKGLGRGGPGGFGGHGRGPGGPGGMPGGGTPGGN